MDTPRLIQGRLVADDRGTVSFVNDFDFGGVKRAYWVSNYRRGFVRAWHGHRREGKYVTVLSGAALVCAVRVDDWDHPDADSQVHRYVLSAVSPSVLFIPAGYANGAMTLIDNTVIQYFSTSTLEESKGDDIRIDARFWNPWVAEER